MPSTVGGVLAVISLVTGAVASAGSGNRARIPLQLHLRSTGENARQKELYGGQLVGGAGSTPSEVTFVVERVPSMDLLVAFDVGTPVQWIHLTIVLDHPYMKVNLPSATSGCPSFIPSLSTTAISLNGTIQIRHYLDTVWGVKYFSFLGFSNCVNWNGGELGLGLSLQDDGVARPVLQQFLTSGLVTKPIFAFHVYGDEHGELVFGDADTSQYAGELKYMPLVDPLSWAVAMDAITLGTVTITISDAVAHINPADLFIRGPARLVKEIAIRAGARNSNDGYLIACGTDLFAARVTLGGENYTLDEKPVGVEIAGKCWFSVQAHEFDAPVWMLGGPFTRKYYTMFDGQEKRVGVATLAPQSHTLLP